MRGDPRATRRQVLRLGSCGCGDEGERQEGPASHDKLLSGGAVTVLSGGGSVTSANPRYIHHAEPPSRHVARDPARVAACPPLQAHCRTRRRARCCSPGCDNSTEVTLMRPLLLVALVSVLTTDRALGQQAVKYVRYSHAGRVAYGLLEGDRVRELSGGLFSNPRPTGRTARLGDVKILAPVEPSKVIAVGLNYKSHLGERPTATYPGPVSYTHLTLPTSDL